MRVHLLVEFIHGQSIKHLANLDVMFCDVLLLLTGEYPAGMELQGHVSLLNSLERLKASCNKIKEFDNALKSIPEIKEYDFQNV